MKIGKRLFHRIIIKAKNTPMTYDGSGIVEEIDAAELVVLVVKALVPSKLMVPRKPSGSDVKSGVI